MTGLLELRERLRNFYGKCEIYIRAGVKFVLGLVVFALINGQLGYMDRLDHPAVTLVLALICSFLPLNIMSLLAGAVILIHLSALSLEVCVTAFCLFLLLFFLYGKYASKNDGILILTPILCFFKVPQVMPVACGLLRRPAEYLSIVCGVTAYYYLEGVNGNIASFTSTEEAEILAKFSAILKTLTGNKEMYLVLAAFMITSLTVYLIRRQSIDHAWRIGLLLGNLLQMIILLIGYVLLGKPEKIFWVVAGSVISVAVSLILEFLFYNLDYSRIERVQFEDDEYYYFVKAVPKMYVARKDKRVKRITHRRKTVSRRELAEELEIDQDLLN